LKFGKERSQYTKNGLGNLERMYLMPGKWQKTDSERQRKHRQEVLGVPGFKVVALLSHLTCCYIRVGSPVIFLVIALKLKAQSGTEEKRQGLT
jgi:hypothetical protein